ncbi:RNA-directed DNA polymerase, eukaryota, reverse transcriptase zinc-binding domain protein [Tanacetum coccineum]
MGIGVNMGVVESAANLIGCSILHSPFNYLGVKVRSNMTRISSWDDVVSKVSSRLSKWKLKSLSIGGRLTLLKSVLTSTPLYHMSIYKVPMGVLKKLESIRRNFFNGNDGSIRKHTWFNWSKALASKKNGGLGVSSFFAYNRALLFKWVWRFFTDGSSLWSSFIKALFGNHGALENSLQTHPRSTWIDIINAIKSLNDKGINLSYFIRKKIGNGENTSFWDDIWLRDIAFKDQFKRLYALDERKSISVAEKLGHTSICHSFRRPPRGGIEQESLNSLCMIVNEFVLPNMDDRWSWSLEGSGLFTVKSSRSFIDDIFLPNAGVSTRWIKVLPIKINVFAWKVFLDALPTRINLSLRGIDIPSIQCPICNLAVESSSHIFFSCPVACKVWRKIMIWWELDDPAFHSYNEWLLWIVNIRLPKQLKEFLEGCGDSDEMIQVQDGEVVDWCVGVVSRNSIMNAVRCTRPDVAFAQNLTSRFQQNSGELHWTAVKNILKVKCYCDAGFETDRDDTKSQTGYVFVLNGGTVDWKSTKQSITAMSAIESEYIAASEAAMKAVWIRKFISGLGIVPTINEPLNMYCDNSAAVHYANKPGIQRGARHYHIRYHYVRECVELGEIRILKVHTDNNLADPFTKALSNRKLTQHARGIGLRPASSFM